MAPPLQARGHAQGGENPGQSDRGGALDVVVEAAVVVPVPVEDVEGRGVPKVLELDEAVGPVALLHGVHELLHQLVVLGPALSGLAAPHVELLLAQRRVVGAYVKRDGKGVRRVDPPAGNVQL